MKTLGALLIVLLLAGPLSAENPTTQRSTATRPAAPPGVEGRYLQLHEQNKARAKQGNIDVLFIGDSITAGWNGQHGRDLWKKNFEPLRAANFGVGSDTPAKLLWRMNDGTLDGIQPKVVVLLIGTNTLGPNLATAVTENIHAIQQRLPNAKILLMAVFPRHAPNDPPTIEENRLKANAELAKLDDGKTLRFLDLSDKMAPGGKFDGAYFVSDGIHLNRKGYDLWAERITPILKSMLEAPATQKEKRTHAAETS